MQAPLRRTTSLPCAQNHPELNETRQRIKVRGMTALPSVADLPGCAESAQMCAGAREGVGN